MIKKLTLLEQKEYGTVKNRDWHQRNILVFLDKNLYPDELLSDTFLILTKEEIKELEQKTQRRIKHYNRKFCPKGWAGFTEK